MHAGEVLAVVELASTEEIALTDRLLRSHDRDRIRGRRVPRPSPRRARAAALTARELEVLQLAAQGYSGRQIAERLRISPATIKTHFEHIYAKFGVSGRAAAVAQAMRAGLIT